MWNKTKSEWRRNCTSRYLHLLLFASAAFTLFTYQILYSLPKHMDSMLLYKELAADVVDRRQACQIPLYHPFQTNVLSYFTAPRPISCRSRTPLLTFIDIDGYLKYNLTGFSEAGYTTDQLSCYFQEITRANGEDNAIEYGPERLMTGKDRLQADFVYVACHSWVKVYSMFHAHAQRQAHVREFRDEEEVGVAVVGLDSVSRLNFMRQLPRSYRAITNTLGGVVLKGFNKVGHNTLPNIVPILTGNPPIAHPLSSTFDDWPFIWTPLGQDGVATLYGEDLSRIMTFSWFGDGFRVLPTTHYFRPFWLAVDSSALNAWSSPLCLGPVPKHRVYIDYLRSFLRTYRRSPVFLFSLENEPSHDYLNTVGVMDDDLEEFLLSSYREGLFNRTILLVLADHGQRMDTFRKTRQGKIEDMMPMVSVVLPGWYSRKFPHVKQALHDNMMRLTSSYDLYATFVDIFNRTSVTKVSVKKEGTTAPSKYSFRKPAHGLSFFTNIPLDRSCSDAGVPDMFCVCEEHTITLQVDNALAVKSANVLINYINEVILEGGSSLWNQSLAQLSSNRKLFDQNEKDTDLSVLEKCGKLTHVVKEAQLMVRPNGIRLVHVTFETYPNGALFEGRVEWNGEESGEQGRVLDDVVRINRYGDESDCMPRILLTLVPSLRGICYCT